MNRTARAKGTTRAMTRPGEQEAEYAANDKQRQAKGLAGKRHSGDGSDPIGQRCCGVSTHPLELARYRSLNAIG